MVESHKLQPSEYSEHRKEAIHEKEEREQVELRKWIK